MIRVTTPAGGRMGNQMFQLAFAHAASRRLGTEYVYARPMFKSDELGPPLWKCFEIGAWAHAPVRLARRCRFALQAWRDAEVVNVDQHDDPGEVLDNLRDGVVYSGFFQSERWFAGYEEEVRELFRIKPRHVEEFERVHVDRPPYVCMHVRRTDYLDTKVWALPTSFFLDALAAVPNRHRYQVVVVSDDPATVREELAGAVPDLRCESGSPMADLQLLMNADVVIPSNSSFSWWGAWLNRRPNVQVIAPRHWLGFAAGVEEPAKVIPDRWTTVPVRDAPLLPGALQAQG